MVAILTHLTDVNTQPLSVIVTMHMYTVTVMTHTNIQPLTVIVAKHLQPWTIIVAVHTTQPLTGHNGGTTQPFFVMVAM